MVWEGVSYRNVYNFKMLWQKHIKLGTDISHTMRILKIIAINYYHSLTLRLDSWIIGIGD